MSGKLKRIGYKAGLNCGRCTSRHGNKCSEGEYCSNWFLHKFRHTFATAQSSGACARYRILQLWLGHSDLVSTMVYLEAVRNKDVAVRVNGSELAAVFHRHSSRRDGPSSRGSMRLVYSMAGLSSMQGRKNRGA